MTTFLLVSGLAIGVSLALLGMIWNAIYLARVGAPSLPAARLLLGGLALIPLGAGTALLTLAPAQPLVLLGALPLVVMAAATMALASRLRDRS